MSELDIQVMTIGGDSVGIQEGRERAELDRRIRALAERHIDERRSMRPRWKALSNILWARLLLP